jgi:hypothetical protein
MPASLTNLQDLRTALGRLNAERPASLHPKPGETQYEQRGGSFLRRLTIETTSRQRNARILITGQIGVGKSSELLQFYYKRKVNRGRGFVVYCDLEKEEAPEKCGATGVFLTVFRDCWSSTRNFQYGGLDELSRVRTKTIEQLVDWLKGEYTQDRNSIVFKFGGMNFNVSLYKPDGALALILGKSAQHEAVSEPTDRFGLVPDSLINLLNELLRWFTHQCRGQAPLLIVDHVDKIRNEIAAEDVLVKAMPQWNRIEASIIMTAPYEHTLGILRNSIESRWGPPLHLHPLEFPEIGKSIPSIYLSIIKSARLERLIRPESLNILAHYSGGILRTFVLFLINACKEAHFANHDNIELSDAESVVHAAERAYQDYGTQELDLLDQISQSGTGLGQAATLLRSPIGLLVAEPSGREQRLLVHPLAENALNNYRLRKGKVSSRT